MMIITIPQSSNMLYHLPFLPFLLCHLSAFFKQAAQCYEYVDFSIAIIFICYIHCIHTTVTISFQYIPVSRALKNPREL